jgi:hypothetical protein
VSEFRLIILRTSLGGSCRVIFQIAQNLTMAGGKSVFLIGGAKSNNVFWQVGAR